MVFIAPNLYIYLESLFFFLTCHQNDILGFRNQQPKKKLEKHELNVNWNVNRNVNQIQNQMSMQQEKINRHTPHGHDASVGVLCLKGWRLMDQGEAALRSLSARRIETVINYGFTISVCSSFLRTPPPSFPPSHTLPFPPFLPPSLRQQSRPRHRYLTNVVHHNSGLILRLIFNFRWTHTGKLIDVSY